MMTTKLPLHLLLWACLDSHTKSRVALLPIAENGEGMNAFKGIKYLGIYPFVDATGLKFWVQHVDGPFILLKRWINGEDPAAK